MRKRTSRVNYSSLKTVSPIRLEVCKGKAIFLSRLGAPKVRQYLPNHTEGPRGQDCFSLQIQGMWMSYLGFPRAQLCLFLSPRPSEGLNKPPTLDILPQSW